MTKKGPQRFQSLKAFPGSSLLGFGKTTSFKLLTIRDKSLLTVSQTGSVSVFGGKPKPNIEIPPPDSEERGGSCGIVERTEGTGASFGLVGEGRLEGIKEGGDSRG
ncbi:unnamed protein product [Fraxinus pennsylvanica]|uniref:Uncharacterized protein n=1 Tax=Fraxinus pennsylvanica TaxID=56036 RepID=A0AAD2A7L9_9LAMI|nr:unnamed protein product [Fraxinus pennsylvanica]